MRYIPTGLVLALLLPVAAAAQPAPPAMTTGPVFADFGAVATIESDLPVPAGMMLRHVYDVTEAAPAGGISPGIAAAARFLNLHVRAGVPMERLQVALVVHSAAVADFTRPEVFARRKAGAANGSAAALAAVMAKGVRVYICGQAAAAQGLGKADFLPGVQAALSASSAHAILQADGWSLNPF